MNTQKHSKQRDAIVQVLKNTKSHPTADWVYEEVRKQIPNISLGTVYRNLAKLSDDSL
ncbi:MAG: transcriptional repressor, partial [Clostridia bacterium]|nr:transcriptional repressor [Clostridia bacterium]